MNTRSSSLPPLTLIAGPTASGKSALAMALAERENGVVINADSAQVYRDLRVVTARPSESDEARVPHRLYGYRDGTQPGSAADWAADAKRAIEDAQAVGKLPIVVGGTGLYFRTLVEGIAPVPAIDPEIRTEVRALPVAEAHEALRNEDAAAAERLRPSDTTRIARALEVIRSTGRPLATWQSEKEGGIEGKVALMPLVLLPPRNWLYERCDRRFDETFREQGLEEVRLLLEPKLDPALPVMRAIGVPEMASFLGGTCSRADALQSGQTATRQYAKRQYTWFRRQPPPDWPRYTDPLDCRGMADALAQLQA